MSDEKPTSLQVVSGTVPGTSLIDLDKKELEEKESRERIRSMTDVGRLTNSQLEDMKIIYSGMNNSKVLNEFRELRTNIYKLIGKQENFVLLVSSICPGGGSSFVTMNLAAAIALDESKTSVVVECNICDPILHELLPVEPDYGLVDYLENVSLGVEDIIYSSGIRRMRLIPAGSRREIGTEFFTSARMARFIDEIRRRYRDRFIIIDAPPIETSADARILAELCDYALLVVPSGRVTETQIEDGIEAIGESKLAGVIFNN